MGLFAALAAAAPIVGDIIGGNQERRAAEDAARSAEYTPFNISSGIGTGAFDMGTKTATTTLDPRLASLASSLFGRAERGLTAPGISPELQQMGQQATQTGSGFLAQLNAFDPFQAAEEQFNRLEKILQPGRDTARQNLEARLLRQGRLGLNAEGVGQPEQLAFQTAVERNRSENLYNAFGQAQQAQQNLFGLGTGLGAFGSQVESFAPQLEGANIANVMSAIEGGVGLERQPLGLLELGGAFGSQKAQAGAAQGQFQLKKGEIAGARSRGFGQGFGSAFGSFI